MWACSLPNPQHSIGNEQNWEHGGRGWVEGRGEEDEERIRGGLE